MNDAKTLNENLGRAAWAGDLNTVKDCLAQGADIHADQDYALYNASWKGYTEIVSFLLDKGADIHARDRREGFLDMPAAFGHTNTVALLLAAGADSQVANNGALSIANEFRHPAIVELLKMIPAIEKKIDRYAHEQPQSDQKTLRRLAYGTVVIGMECGLKREALWRFVDATMQQNLAYKPTPAAGNNGALDMLGERMSAFSSPEALLQQIGVQPFTQATAIRDMVSEYAQAKLLPQLLLEAGVAETPRHLKRIKQKTLDAWQEKLLPIAAEILLAGKNLHEIVEMSASWHRGNAIPHALRPLRSGKWHKLIEDTPTPIMDAQGTPITIRALSSIDALRDESRHLNHCVGKSPHYSDACQKGEIHILSVQADNLPLATLEIKLTGNAQDPLRVVQYSGASDRRPPAIATQAWEWFAAELKKPEHQRASGIALNARPPEGWGRKKIRGEKSHPPAVKMIGFTPSKENIRACHDHLRDHIKVKQPVLSQRKREGAFYTPRDTEVGYSWRQQLPQEAPASADMGEAWQALLEEVKTADSGWRSLLRPFGLATAGAAR